MIKYFMLITFVVIAGLKAPAFVLSCHEVYSPGRSENMASVSTNLLATSITKYKFADIYSNPEKNQIGWETFENLRKLKKDVSFYAGYLKSLSPEQRAHEKIQFIKLINSDKNVRTLFKNLETFKKFEYMATDYELRKAMTEEIISILKLLPPDWRPRVAKIPWDQRRNQVNAQAEEILKKHEKAFDEIFPTIGNKDYAEYERELREAKDPWVRKAIRMIDKGQIKAGTWVRESGRFWVPKVGFQNVYVAKTSAAGDLEKQDYRHLIESVGLGQTKSEYYPEDHETKPKYGVLVPDQNLFMKSHIDEPHPYGQDFYTFKTEKIKNRLTYTMGDSYLLTAFWNHTNAYAMRNTETDFRPRSWRGMAIPWSRRLLMVPYMIAGLESNSFIGAYFNSETKSYPHNKQVINSGFFEAQIYGQLDLKMVETFAFRKNPPAGEFLAALRENNIEIWDARLAEPIPWNGDK